MKISCSLFKTLNKAAVQALGFTIALAVALPVELPAGAMVNTSEQLTLATMRSLSEDLLLVHCCHGHPLPPYDRYCCHGGGYGYYGGARYGYYGAAGVRGTSRRVARRTSRRVSRRR